MKTTILAFGTRGDVVPLTGLGRRLGADGVDVTIAAQESYRDDVERSGLDFAPLPHDTLTETRASTTSQALVDGARMRPSTAALAEMRAGMSGVGEAMAQAAAGADLLLLEGPVGALLGKHVAAALDLPSVGIMFQPACPTGAFSPPALGTRSFGRIGNRLAWRLGALGERAFAPTVAELRTNLGLPPKTSTAEERRFAAWPIVHAFSETVLPRPADWPEHVRVGGYLWPHDPEPRLPEHVEAFLADGPAPIAVTLGSTATADGPELSGIIAEATREAGVRAVVQRGWADLTPTGEHILVVDDLPHSLLLPRCVAVLHHCGAGTSAAALRAGIPSIPIPGIMDQPFWAQRLHRLDAATPPISRHRLTTATLIDALRSVDRCGSAAAAIGNRLATEDGAGVTAGLLATPVFSG